MIREAKLKTANMLTDVSLDERDYELWKKIYAYMDGETAIVMKSTTGDGTYVFLGLKDKEKNKELNYMFEQDSMIGVYIDDRETFDRDWDSGDYEPDGCHYLNPANVELIEKASEELEQYRTIGTVEECQAAMERQTAKAPDIWGDGCDSNGNPIYDMYTCPNCKENYEIDCDHHKYCPNCGQAFDRSNLI